MRRRILCSIHYLKNGGNWGMDFIEQILGWSPDNGSGWFEALLFAIPVGGILMIWRHRRGQCQVGDKARASDKHNH